jgi:hypothetical protein
MIASASGKNVPGRAELFVPGGTFHAAAIILDGGLQSGFQFREPPEREPGSQCCNLVVLVLKPNPDSVAGAIRYETALVDPVPGGSLHRKCHGTEDLRERRPGWLPLSRLD